MSVSPTPPSPDAVQQDATLVVALKAGDEQVFSELVSQWSSLMLRLALSHVGNRAVAEEVVQEAWLIVVRSLDRFAGRSSLRTWVLGIVVNTARSRARTERRNVPLDAGDERSVEPARFLPADHPKWPHHWAVEPLPWPTPEQELLAGEIRQVILDAIDALPAAQRDVVTLRDVEGLPAAEICHILDLTDTHQRVLLHRARSRVRKAIERYFAGAGGQ